MDNFGLSKRREFTKLNRISVPLQRLLQTRTIQETIGGNIVIEYTEFHFKPEYLHALVSYKNGRDLDVNGETLDIDLETLRLLNPHFNKRVIVDVSKLDSNSLENIKYAFV